MASSPARRGALSTSTSMAGSASELTADSHSPRCGRLLAFRLRRRIFSLADQHAFPVLEDFGRAAMDLEPEERLPTDIPMRERALRPYAGAEVAEPPLEPENLSQVLDIPPCERQSAEPRNGLGRELSAFRASRRVAAGRRQTERHQQASQQNPVGERLRVRREVSAIRIHGRERLP